MRKSTMTIDRRIIAVLALSFFQSILPPGYTSEPAAPAKTALDDYIAKRDPTYGWKLINTIRGDDYTTFVVDLKSQTWRTTPEVDRPVWQHWLVIVKPDVVKHDAAF